MNDYVDYNIFRHPHSSIFPAPPTCVKEFCGYDPSCLFVLLFWWVILKFLCCFPWKPFVTETLSTYFGRWLQHHAAKGLDTWTRDLSEQPCEVPSSGTRLFGLQTGWPLDYFCWTVSRHLDTLSYLSELKWSKEKKETTINMQGQSFILRILSSYFKFTLMQTDFSVSILWFLHGIFFIISLFYYFNQVGKRHHPNCKN